MKKSGIFLWLIFLLLIGLVTAQTENLGTYKKSECVQLIFNNDSSTYANITGVTYPLNSSFALLGNESMTDNSNGLFNYSFCDTLTLGQYNVYGISDAGDFQLTFTISNLGTNLTTQESIIYLILTLGVFLIFGISLYFAVAIPYGNTTNEKGAVIKVTKAKYFKLFMIGLTYSFFVWLLNILIGVSDNFANLTLYYGFISFLFTIFINLTIPIMVLILIIMGAEIIRDSNVTKTLKRFGSA